MFGKVGLSLPGNLQGSSDLPTVTANIPGRPPHDCPVASPRQPTLKTRSGVLDALTGPVISTLASWRSGLQVRPPLLDCRILVFTCSTEKINLLHQFFFFQSSSAFNHTEYNSIEQNRFRVTGPYRKSDIVSVVVPPIPRKEDTAQYLPASILHVLPPAWSRTEFCMLEINPTTQPPNHPATTRYYSTGNQ
jgi:hypothetical protein